MKRKITLSFTLLAAYQLLNLSVLLNIFRGIPHLFVNFSLAAFPARVFSYLLSTANILIIPAFLFLLYLNTKRDVRQLGCIACLAAGILKLYFFVTNIKNNLFMMMGGFDIFSMVQSGMLGNLVLGLTLGIMLVMGFFHIRNNAPVKSYRLVACIGGFAYIFDSALRLMMGGSVLNVVYNLLLLVGLFYLPATLNNYNSAVLTTKKSLKFVAILLAAALLLPAVSYTIAEGGSSSASSSSTSSSTCGYCSRKFTDSGNKRSIARTGMCSNCTNNYKDMSSWLDSMGG